MYYNKEKWKEKVEEIDARTNSTKLYKHIKFLNGKDNSSTYNEELNSMVNILQIHLEMQTLLINSIHQLSNIQAAKK